VAEHYPGFAEDLSLVLERRKAFRFRDLTDPDHPDYRPEYIAVVRTEAARLRGEQPPAGEPSLPPLASQAALAAAALGRVAVAAVDGQAADNSLAAAGRQLWAELHRRALSYQGDEWDEHPWIACFARRVPCGTCRDEWRQLIQELPPDLTDRESYFRWTVRAHNAVNAKLGKPILSFEEATRLWGWDQT
jgi:hypothetical protein